MDKAEKLKELNNRWRQKCTCALRETATQPVFGLGNPDADIVFIGEAPGKKEDETGKPFIGAAGKFLSKMLESISLSREDIYITNVVKYRPPNNRDPKPKEKSACRDWLLEELQIVEPKLIICLGRHALNDFFPLEQISETHGKLLTQASSKIPTKYFFALYHPAAALYNGSMREVLEKDFKEIPRILKEIAK